MGHARGMCLCGLGGGRLSVVMVVVMCGGCSIITLTVKLTELVPGWSWSLKMPAVVLSVLLVKLSL